MGTISVDLPGTNDPVQAVPYYDAYINADCKLYSEASGAWKPLSDSCQAVNALIDQINEPYTGNSNSARLTWLKRRRGLLIQRAAVIAQALKDLGSTDVVDHTATDIRSISALVGSFSAAVPGIGTAIGLGVSVVGQIIGGIIDTTGDNKARRDDEIALYKADYSRLSTILDQTNQEIDKLSLTNYLLWGGLLALLLVLFLKKRKG